MKVMQCLVVFICLWAVSSHSLAQIYAGAIGGLSTTSPYIGADELPNMSSEIGYRAYFGNRLSEKFSYEIAYVDFGQYEFEERPETTDDTLSVSGVDLSIVGRAPLQRRFLLFGRLGIFDWEGERRLIDESAGVDFYAEEGTTNYHLGVGFELIPTQYMGITLEMNHYRAAEMSILLYGFGVFFTF